MTKICVNFSRTNHNITIDVGAHKAARRAGLSPEEACDALMIVAKYIRAGEPLPLGMDEWLASAIESAIKSPGRNSPDNNNMGHALLVGLGLRSNNRRKSVDWLDVGKRVDSLMDEGMKKTPAIKKVSEKLEIGYATAQKAYTEYRRVKEEGNRIFGIPGDKIE